MSEIRAKGHIMSFFVYFLCGVVFSATFYLKGEGSNINYAVASLFFWMVTSILLLIVGLGKTMGGRIYETLHIIFTSIFAITVQIYWDTPFLVYLLYTLQWLMAVSFLRKHELHLLVGFQTLCLAFLTFTPQWITGFTSFSVFSLIVTFCGLLLADWIGCNLINSLYQMNEEKEEHDRSLDDLLDIVEAKHHEAREATKSKSQFLSNMSHEIRTPLNVVLGMNEMILRETKEKNILEYSENIKNSGNMLYTLVNDILDISKIEEGKMELIPVKFSLSEAFQELYSMIISRAEEKNLEVIFDIDKSLPDVCYGDDVRIRQILINLLNNGIKYTKKGTVTLKVTGSTAGKNVLLNFSVKDTGIGIRKENLDKLNQKFTRINEEQNRYIEGSGLGITIVNSLLALMDSKLEVSSEFGVGSEFSFTLKLKTGDPVTIEKAERVAKSEDRSSIRKKKAFTAPDLKLLVVDDNELNLKVFSGLLKKLLISVDTANSGRKAIEMAEKKKYDAIFMDHMMPEMDGIEATAKIKQDPKTKNSATPIIAITANAMAGARDMYINSGFSEFISKPVRADKLEAMVKRVAAGEL